MEELEKSILEEGAVLKDLRTRLGVIREDTQAYTLKLEQYQIRRLPFYWIFLVIGTLICTFGSYSSGSLLLTATNFIAFLLVWRNVYMPVNIVHTVVAIGIIVITFKFG